MMAMSGAGLGFSDKEVLLHCLCSRYVSIQVAYPDQLGGEKPNVQASNNGVRIVVEDEQETPGIGNGHTSDHERVDEPRFTLFTTASNDDAPASVRSTADSSRHTVPQGALAAQ